MNIFVFNCLSEATRQSLGLDEKKNIRMDGRRRKSRMSGSDFVGVNR